MDEKKLQEAEEKLNKNLERIYFEIRWIEQNMQPPVNYALVIITSIIVTAITTWLFKNF